MKPRLRKAPPSPVALTAALLLSAFFALSALAQKPAAGSDYPTRPIRFVVPSSPGGGADVLGRIVAQKLSEALGKPVVVENRAGAGGIIGYEIVARAPADGYTLLIVAGGYTLNPSLYARLPFDTIAGIKPQ